MIIVLNSQKVKTDIGKTFRSRHGYSGIFILFKTILILHISTPKLFIIFKHLIHFFKMKKKEIKM